MTWRTLRGLEAVARENLLGRSFANRFLRWGTLASLVWTFGTVEFRAEDLTNVVIEPVVELTNAIVPPAEPLATAHALEVMQGELEKLQSNLERSRQEAEAAAGRSAEAMANRLQTIEQSIQVARSREIESLESANRWLLKGAGIFAVMACVMVVSMAWFQWRTVSKLAEITTLIPRANSGMGLGSGERPAGMLSQAVEQANQRFLGTLDRLEKRILELEAFTHPALPENGGNARAGGNGVVAEAERDDEAGSRAASLIGKGSSLLSLDKHEEALACFDEALALEPRHPEGLLKKGTVLEKMGKLEEALGLYDQALEADNSLTVAYLLKGGICNRLERFSEALECYEKALRKGEPAAA